jgi:hypothetical protein
VKHRRNLVVSFALAGFLIAEALCAYAFHLTAHHRIGNTAFFLLLCPPSIGALALDNAGVLGGLIGWLLISIGNAGLYAVIGLALSRMGKVSK